VQKRSNWAGWVKMIGIKNVMEDEVGKFEDRKLLSEEVRRKRRMD
jgi:hypothetical protein